MPCSAMICRHLWFKSIIEKNVGRLDISMNNWPGKALMEVAERFCKANRDLKPLVPS